MNVVWEYARDAVLYVLGSLLHNLPALLLGILVASAIKVYLSPDRMRNWLMRRSAVSIPATVVFGAFTPFCACGTMAIVLAMLATALPWGPIMAFLTSSPLMSPEGFVMISGIIGPSFAIALTVASVVIGIGSGYGAHVIEKKTHFLDNQLRFGSSSAAQSSAGCACSAAAVDNATANTATIEQTGCGCNEKGNEIAVQGCGCGALTPEPAAAVQRCCGGVPARKQQTQRSVRRSFEKYKVQELLKAAFDIGIKKILPYFALFAGIGYLINRLIPAEWISALFGEYSVFAIPLAAIVGLPLYVNGDSAIPMIQSLMQSGVGAGAMLAFMITGPGTSAGVLAGISTILKKRAIGLYVVFLLIGAILLGYAYELVLAIF